MTERHLFSNSDAKQCRICLDTNLPEKFISPCECRGSIEAVHLTCLEEYLSHKFNHASLSERRRMRESIRCEICHSEVRCFKVSPTSRCIRCEQIKGRIEGEDIFFIVIYMILYLGFHTVGVILILQKELLSRVIGGFWLLLSIGVFNYGLYKVIREICYVREVKVNYQPE